ncbi:MAG: enoyl-CoA hydratase/isomerase family protein [Hyphomicrobiales bacterium]|nr:enoyl-CoA hydratase/isomerase family protein [Hyphomicrobiales bacterium]
MGQSLLFQLKDQVGTITFNRPKELNAVNLDMARAMGELAIKLPGVGDMKSIVLRGPGNHFMAGGDISVFHGEKNKTLPVISEIIDHFHAFIFCIQELPSPLSAQSGSGGWWRLLPCDRR